MDDSQLCSAVAARFYAVNGTHPMTVEDDVYASEWYVQLEALAETTSTSASELRRLMLADRLPLPSYIRNDGAQMVAHDLLELPRRAGGYERLPEWFGQQLQSGRDAIREWEGYLRGHYVCLRNVTPETIQRKDELEMENGVKMENGGHGENGGQSSLLTQRHERRSRGSLCLDGSAAGRHASGIDMRVRAR